MRRRVLANLGLGAALSLGLALSGGVARAQLAPVAVPASPAAPVAPAPFTPAERAEILSFLETARVAPPPAEAGDDALAAALAAAAQARRVARVRPAEIDPLWALRPPVRDMAAELAAARATGFVHDWLQALKPADAGMAALEAAHLAYGAMSWSPLPPGPVLRPGQSSPVVPALRARLAAEGYGLAAPPADAASPEAADPTLFAPDLVQALSEFQRRHGLEANGVLGVATRAALDVPPADRAAQIEANLERARWLPTFLPADRLEVDVAAAEAALYLAGQPALTMRVVVGDTDHKTPIFASALEAVVVNPPWKVPNSIIHAELMPLEARDPGYLARHDFTYVDGRLEQRPGPKNSLGQLKFDLDSPFGVYLHDTPAKGAFARARRALSHGCMRLEKPQELAAVLLGAQGWDAAAIAAAIAKGDTRRVGLDKPLPLYVVYRTVVADPAGGVRFVPDVYGWDAELAAVLQGRTP